ncbi:MAG: alginate export family protein [Bacteroidota bacterium]
MKQIFLSIMMLVLFASPMLAQQFDLSAEIRPRFESNHGYKKLIGTDATGTNAISQRSRLNFFYKQDKIKLGITLQNVRTWGDISTLASADINGTALHQAWASVSLLDNLCLKLGRQEIVYDDHRIFGSVGWAQQARSHDALIFKYKPADGHKLDVGYALNPTGSPAGYKNFFYGWYHGDFDKIGLSVLALNTGHEFENTDEVTEVGFKQTVGPRVTFKMGDLDANAATYFQVGDYNDVKTNALYYTFNLGYKVMDGLKLGVGYEALSGNDMDDANGEQNSFAPLFGTNHKFNGWMDYFYVGSHMGSVGLNDINATVAYKNGKFSAKLIPHFFSAAGNVHNGAEVMDANLGTEVDFTMGYKIAPAVSINFGHSMMFATETMEFIETLRYDGVSGDKDEMNSWTWLQFTFKPKLFSSAPKAE